MGRTRLSTLSFLLYCLSIAVDAASEAPRPRGVGPEFAKYYRDPETFTCISAPSITLPIARLNDDYCDCPDGSDEPGTSACSHLSPLSPPHVSLHNNLNETPALPGYYCKNKGHQPSYIPFTYVNDGVCDYDLCCDGSDEYDSVGGVKCEDRCAKIGKEWRKQDEARQKSLGAANKKRKELVKEAGRLKKEVEDRIQTLKTQIEGAELKVAALEKNVAEIERQEKGKVFKGAAGGQGGKLAILTGLAKERIAELVENLERVREERDEARKTVQELEEILRKFKEEYNPNFNDEGVKRAVKAWEDYSAQEKPAPDSAHDRDLDEILKSDAENGINWEEYEHHEESDVEVLYKFEAYLPTPVRNWLDDKLRSLRVLMIENGILADPHSSDAPESKRVTDARQQLNTARSELDADKSELTRHQEDLTKDYGPDDVFRALKGTCIEQDSGEYTYEFCWLDKTTQKSKKGHGHTGMGNFARIEKIVTDEDLPADGKGVGTGERYVLKFENGQHCWNGPSRSTMVVLACAEKDEIWKVVEEEKCVYRMEVGSPSVCESGKGGAQQAPAHNEL